MPSTRTQNLSNLDAANRHRITKAHLRKQLRAGHIDLWPVLVSKYTQQLTVLEVLGLAFIGRGLRGGPRSGRLALTVAAAMPFSVTHGTLLGSLTYPQCGAVYREFAALAAEEAAMRESSRASL